MTLLEKIEKLEKEVQELKQEILSAQTIIIDETNPCGAV